MAVNFFVPTFRKSVAPVDLNIAQQAYQTLEQGHNQTIAQASAFKTALAQLDLNEKEDAWRQERIAEIESSLSENSNYGNAYSAFDDVVKTNADIVSSAGMLGRLRAQADYKKYNETLNARQDIDEDTKRMFRELNPYHYEDKYDDKGNVIAGTKWQPIRREVSAFNLSEHMPRILQLVAKEAGGSSGGLKLNDDGFASYYSSTSMKYETLPASKIKQAIKAYIDGNPLYKAGVEQEYDVQQWKLGKGEQSDIVDNAGNILTFDKFLESKIDPFAKSAAYSHRYTDTNYHNFKESAQAIAKQNASGGQSLDPLAKADLNSRMIIGAKQQAKNTIVADTYAKRNVAAQHLADLFRKTGAVKGADAIMKFTQGDYKAAANLHQWINDKFDRNSNDYKEAMQALSDFNNSSYYLNSIKKNLKQSDRDKIDTYNAIMSNGLLPNNKEALGFRNLQNSIFDGKTKEFVIEADDDKIFNKVISSLGGKKAVEQLGFKFGKKDGYPTIIIPENKKQALLSTLAAINHHQNGWIVRDLVYYKHDGKGNYSDETKITGQLANDTNIKGGKARLNSIGQIISGNLKSLQEDNASILKEAGDITYDRMMYEGTSPEQALNAAKFRLTGENNFNARSKSLEVADIKAIKSINFANIKLYEGTNDGYETEITDATAKKEAQDIIRSGTFVNVNHSLDPITDKMLFTVTVQLKNEKGQVTGKGKTYTFVGDGAFEDKGYIQRFKRDTSIRAGASIQRGKLRGDKIDLTDFTVTDQALPHMYAKPVGGDKYMLYKDNMVGADDEIGAISEDDLFTAKDALISLQDLRGEVRTGKEIDSDKLNGVLDRAVKAYSSVFGLDNPNAVKQLIVNNIYAN